MPYDQNDTFNRPGQSASGSGSETDRLGANLSDTTGDRSASAFSDTSGTLGRESLGGGRSTVDETADQTKERMRSAKQRATERVTHFKTTLADKLDAGAERLRRKSADANLAEAGAETQGNVRKVGSKVASGMESTAEWIRTADMQSMKSGVENQVRTKPGRALLVALGIGYVVGRALRGKRGA
ncbi:MAG TPA: hypothetical protein VF041_16200 [Gemmatimonadaceae bacterium]